MLVIERWECQGPSYPHGSSECQNVKVRYVPEAEIERLRELPQHFRAMGEVDGGNWSHEGVAREIERFIDRGRA